MRRILITALLAALTLGGQAHATPFPFKHLKRILFPFRSNFLRQAKSAPCRIGFAVCPAVPVFSLLETTKLHEPVTALDPSQLVTLQTRAEWGGPFAHRWLEVESSSGPVTIGYGPATIPFIDAGQISLGDAYGNVERISGIPLYPMLAPPPANYHYARKPQEGHPVGEPVTITVAQADTLIAHMQHKKFVGPYIPIFHDCRTFVCSVKASAAGKSQLPCYLLFKGYW